MKSNVDLTENMMFSQESNTYHPKVPWRKGSNYALRKFPWKMSDELLSQKVNIIALGSASERKQFYTIQKAASYFFCDCCGKEIQIVPWRPSPGLCFQCESQLQQQFSDRCPWRENS